MNCDHVEDMWLPRIATVASRKMVAKSLVLKVINLYMKFLAVARGILVLFNFIQITLQKKLRRIIMKVRSTRFPIIMFFVTRLIIANSFS